MERGDGTLSRSDFQCDEQANEYHCPEGKVLTSDWRPFKKPRDRITKVKTINYRSRESDCATCPNKDRCCPNTTLGVFFTAVLTTTYLVRWEIPPTQQIAEHNQENAGVVHE